MSDMATLIAEVKILKEKIKELEAKPGSVDTEKIKALEEKIARLENMVVKPLEESDFESWD